MNGWERVKMMHGAGSRNDRRHDLSRLASVGQIAAGIAHEVQNPLTSVKGFLQLLQRENPHKYLDMAQSELEHAIAALQRLLMAAKPDLDHEPPQHFNPCVELESILTLFPGQTDRIRIRKEFRDHNVRLFGKKHQLRKAFYNVLKNAFEAIPGEGTVTIRQRASDSEMTLEISDTGVGIPADKLDLLGTPFYTTKFGGTGMGLAQVYATVYQHGGSIEVRSAENAGTSFILHLPLMSGFREETAHPDLLYSAEMDFREFLEHNRSKFEWALLQRAAEMTALSEKPDPGVPAEREPASTATAEAAAADAQAADADPALPGELLNCTHRLIRLIIDKQEYDIVLLAAEQGRAWANRRHPDLAAMVAWYRAVRRTVWTFLVYYDRLGHQPRTAESFHAVERQINDGVDLFLQHACFHYLEEQNRKWRERHRDGAGGTGEGGGRSAAAAGGAALRGAGGSPDREDAAGGATAGAAGGAAGDAAGGAAAFTAGRTGAMDAQNEPAPGAGSAAACGAIPGGPNDPAADRTLYARASASAGETSTPAGTAGEGPHADSSAALSVVPPEAPPAATPAGDGPRAGEGTSADEGMPTAATDEGTRQAAAAPGTASAPGSAAHPVSASDPAVPGSVRDFLINPQIIPLTPAVSLLPMYGAIDAGRARAVLHRVLHQLEDRRPAVLFVDLAQTSLQDIAAAELFLQMLDGIALMGPDIVVTGVRAETARLLVRAGFRSYNRIHVGSTLQQALAKHGKIIKGPENR